MSIDIKKIQDIKKVDKPWGYEKWIADGSPNFRYALKEILLKSNNGLINQRRLYINGFFTQFGWHLKNVFLHEGYGNKGKLVNAKLKFNFKQFFRL